MSDQRVKDMTDIEGTLTEDTYVPGDSVATATGKGRIKAWVKAGIVWALANATTALNFGGRAVSGIAGLTVASGGLTVSAGGATINGDTSIAGDTYVNGAVECDDPTTSAQAATKNYVDTQFQRYTPTYVRSGGAGGIAQHGDVIAQRTGNLVVLHGVLRFTPTTPGANETITFTMPTSFVPNNNFSGNGECGGVHLMGLHAATDFATEVVFVAATKTLRFSVTSNPATDVSWWAQYHINN